MPERVLTDTPIDEVQSTTFFPIRHFGSYMPPPGRHLPEQQNSTPGGVP